MFRLWILSLIVLLPAAASAAVRAYPIEYEYELGAFASDSGFPDNSEFVPESGTFLMENQIFADSAFASSGIRSATTDLRVEVSELPDSIFLELDIESSGDVDSGAFGLLLWEFDFIVESGPVIFDLWYGQNFSNQFVDGSVTLNGGQLFDTNGQPPGFSTIFVPLNLDVGAYTLSGQFTVSDNSSLRSNINFDLRIVGPITAVPEVSPALLLGMVGALLAGVMVWRRRLSA